MEKTLSLNKNLIKTVKTKYIDYIIGRKELEYLLKNNYDFKNHILISIINPENKFNIVKKQINVLKNFLNSSNENIFFPIYQEFGEFEKKQITKSKAKKYLSSLNRYLNKHDEHFDVNSVPIKSEYQNKFYNVLTIDFWDVTEDLEFYKPVSDKKAKEIAKFIYKQKENVLTKKLKFVINCSAGISRSSAIGMAIHCCLDFEGDIDKFEKENCEIFSHKRYKPNEFVFKKVCKEYKDLI